MRHLSSSADSKRPEGGRLPLRRYAPWLATLALGLAVFLFWRLRYPFALVYQEQLQLFLFDGDYLATRLAEPGGLARYVAEFLVQFYNSVTLGSIILAVLFMLVQRLTWQLMKPVADGWYALSFVPAIMLWYAMGDENMLLTYTVALTMALAAALAARCLGRRALLVAAAVGIPILYWLIGPMVLLVAVCLSPAWVAAGATVYAIALILGSAWIQPYPLLRLVLGVDYYRAPMTLPYVLMVIPAVTTVLCHGCRRLPLLRRPMAWGLAAGVALLGLVGLDRGYDSKKYELIEYDYLVRLKDWQGIIAKAEAKTPDLPMSVSATNLALAMTNQLGDRAFDFYQRGTEGLLPKFERNFATTQLTGEIYFHLGLVNTAQRLAFEAMESIPNYNKSGRVVKRLAETNLINGEYAVARKYLKMLEKTIFYRPWAERTLRLLGNEAAINAHPLYGSLRQFRLADDFLFSEDELDKICGQLFLHNQKNQMAAQYLLMAPLLDIDIARFMSYAQYVQSQINYNPRHCQEAIAFAFMQQRQQPPQGLVSQFVLQQMNEFARIYAANSSSPELGRFRNTAWYYLTIGK